jgi:hypothetical protein
MHNPVIVENGKTASTLPRRVFIILSPRSLGYARLAMSGLFRNILEPIHLHLITDTAADRELLLEELCHAQQTGHHGWSVYAEDELNDLESQSFRNYPTLRLFRHGHPCWRKLTDPVLLSKTGDEMIVLDPDLYFPGRFCFETTPERTLLLMWQKPNCLFPPEVVRTAFEEKIPLARHVDIGVAQWRTPVDLEWLEWLLGKLGGKSLPRVMHVEAIVWAALAMRIGGGHLAPTDWHCWHSSQIKRFSHRFGVPGHWILRFEPFGKMKCFHAGGEAKYWLAEAQKRDWIGGDSQVKGSHRMLPFVELTERRFDRERWIKDWLARLGYYRILHFV